jgi:hypothetical protein
MGPAFDDPAQPGVTDQVIPDLPPEFAPNPNVLPLPPDGIGSLTFWRGEIAAARDEIRKELTDWRENLKRYMGGYHHAHGFDLRDTTQVNIDYEKTEQKKAQLFYKVPEVVLSPRNPESAAAVPVFNAVLNQKLGPDDTDALSAVDECLSDVICPAGIAWVKVGYTASVTPPTEMGQPPTVSHSCYYIERGSPAKLLVPSGFIRSNYQQADWLGFRSFVGDEELATLSDVHPPATDQGSRYDEDLLCDTNQRHVGRPGKAVTEIWYWAYRCDPTVTDRRIVRHLILVEDEDTPRVHENSPYQRVDPQSGALLGVEGFPIKVLTLRYTPDSHFPKSDCQMSRPAVDELSQTRTIQMQQKRRALPMRGVDKGRIDPSTIAKLEQGEVQSIILTDGPPHEIIEMIALPTLPRDTSIASDISMRDIDRAWALGQNQSGITEQGSKTATELTYMNQATDVRLDKERDKVLRWFVSICSALGGLIQLFEDDLGYVEVAGQNGAKALQAWNRLSVPGKFVYSVKPDSAKRLDQQVERKMALDRYQLTANDPFNNRMEGLKDVYAAFGEDPARHLQQPPTPPPEKPRISLSFKAEDLTNPMVVSLLQQSGFQIDPNALKQTMAIQTGNPALMQAAAQSPAQPPAPPYPQGPPAQEHGGSAQLQAPLNQHSLVNHIGGGR